MKFFMFVIIVMADIFHLFHAVTLVYNGGSCLYLENVEYCK